MGFPNRWESKLEKVTRAEFPVFPSLVQDKYDSLRAKIHGMQFKIKLHLKTNSAIGDT
jgi:hypothetical protein